ncbi:helix loop helix DNA-binding domain protein, partial [Rhizoctonia solani 123E]
MSAGELVKSRPARASASSTLVQYRPIAPVTPIPVVEPPPKAKRGRKPNPGSKSAREALRKESHSRIEKRRREKINETLTTLRELIAEGEGNTRQQHSPPPGPEREFKLELLERTVAFVRGLVDKTRRLEQELNDLRGPVPGDEEDADPEPPRKRKRAATPSSSPQAGPSREHDSVVEDIDIDGSSVLSELESEVAAPLSPAPTPHRNVVFPTIAPRRSMSIAALLSPSVVPALPSPPPSGNLHSLASASAAESQMESLSLPSPEVSLYRTPMPGIKASRRPTSDPDPEDTDTAAATLLLQFSSKTPMSMLGMR